jgi:hypothetical protein
MLTSGARLGAAFRVAERTNVALYAYAAATLTPMRMVVSDEPVWQSAPLHGGVAVGGQWSP